MLTSSRFELTIDNAPCPPFFVDNIYEIFISTAENNSLSTNVTLEIWNKCSLQYPYPTTTTTSTTTSTTTPTTTSTTTSTTSEQTTTSTTKPTTTEKPTITSTTKQTTTSKREPTITSTTKQTTTLITFPTSTSTTEKSETYFTSPKSTPSTGQTSTRGLTSEQTTILTTDETTHGPKFLTSSAECNSVCLALTVSFAICVIVGIVFAMLCFSANSRRRKKKLKATRDQYIQKIPHISMQGYMSKEALAFNNPSFNRHDSYFPTTQTQYTGRTILLPEADHSHYEVIVNPDKLWNPDQKRNDQPSKAKKIKNSHRMPTKAFTQHHYIDSFIPKLIADKEEVYPNGDESYDVSSSKNGLPKIDIDHSETDSEIKSDIGPHKLPRIPLEGEADFTENHSKAERSVFQTNQQIDENTHVNKSYTKPKRNGLPKIPFESVDKNINSNHIALRQGLPRTEIEETHSGVSRIQDIYKHGLPRTPIEVPVEKGDTYKCTKQCGLPRIPLKDYERNIYTSIIGPETYFFYTGS